MLLPREKLIEELNSSLSSVNKSRAYKVDVATYVHDKFGIQPGDVMDYISKRKELSGADDFVLFIISTGLDEIINTAYVSQYYTTSEINLYNSQRIDPYVIDFPIIIPCVQVANDQWIGTCDVKFIVELRNAQLVYYNINAQRTLRHVVKNGSEYYKIAINKRALSQIRNLFESGAYIPNTITLNIPEDEFDFKYNKEKSQLIINSLNHFDIADGYHRYLAMTGIADSDPDFNYGMELRITHFSEERIRQFIYQEDQKTKMRRIDSDSMNMNNPANLVVERLNRNPLFDWSGQISRNDGIVNFAELAQVIDYFYFSDKPNKAEVNRRVINLSREIAERLNVIIEKSGDVLINEKVDFVKLMLLFHCLKEYDDINDQLDHITNGLSNIDQIDDMKEFKQKKPRRKLVDIIQTII